VQAREIVEAALVAAGYATTRRETRTGQVISFDLGYSAICITVEAEPWECPICGESSRPGQAACYHVGIIRDGNPGGDTDEEVRARVGVEAWRNSPDEF
jgi:hypothetical protein